MCMAPPPAKKHDGETIKAIVGRPEPTLLVSADDLTVAIWNETCDILDSMSILSKSDKFLLEAYCLNVRELYLLTQRIQKNGHAQISDDGSKKTDPDVVSYHKCMATHIKLMGELALTPQSRLRMVAPEAGNASADKVGDLMKKLGGE